MLLLFKTKVMDLQLEQDALILMNVQQVLIIVIIMQYVQIQTVVIHVHVLMDIAVCNVVFYFCLIILKNVINIII